MVIIKIFPHHSSGTLQLWLLAAEGKRNNGGMAVTVYPTCELPKAPSWPVLEEGCWAGWSPGQIQQCICCVLYPMPIFCSGCTSSLHSHILSRVLCLTQVPTVQIWGFYSVSQEPEDTRWDMCVTWLLSLLPNRMNHTGSVCITVNGVCFLLHCFPYIMVFCWEVAGVAKNLDR